MKKKLMPILFAFIAVFASTSIAYADPGHTPPIRPYPSETIQPSSVDIELEGILYEQEKTENLY